SEPQLSSNKQVEQNKEKPKITAPAPKVDRDKEPFCGKEKKEKIMQNLIQDSIFHLKKLFSSKITIFLLLKVVEIHKYCLWTWMKSNESMAILQIKQLMSNL